MNAIAAEILLLAVDRIFRTIGVTYWLNYGTLLAAVRDGAFIPSDTDIDLMIRQRDWNEKYYDAFTRRNFNAPQTRAINGRTSALCLALGKGLRIDVNVLSEDNFTYFLPEQFRRHLTLGTMPHVIPKKYLDVPAHVGFLGQLFRIPNDAEVFLADIYGEDWRTPLPYSQWQAKLKETE